MRRRTTENDEEENGQRTDGLCLYVKKKTFLGRNKKSYFYVKSAYVFMFLCFWECSNVAVSDNTQTYSSCNSTRRGKRINLLTFIFLNEEKR